METQDKTQLTKHSNTGKSQEHDQCKEKKV